MNDDDDDIIIIIKITGGKRPGCETDHSFHLVERLRIGGTLPPFPRIFPMRAQAEFHLLQVLKFPIFQRRRNRQEDKPSNIQTGECRKSPFSVRQGRKGTYQFWKIFIVKCVDLPGIFWVLYSSSSSSWKKALSKPLLILYSLSPPFHFPNIIVILPSTTQAFKLSVCPLVH